MRLALGLLLFSLGVAMGRETAAEQKTASDNATIVRGDNQFAVDLYAQLDREQPGKNLFFSPTSISIALTMTAAGARGQTESEMAKVLHLDADMAKAHAHYHRLLEQWNAVGQKRAYKLCVANRLWGQKGFPIRPEFLALTRQQYGAEMLLLDFAQAEAACWEINHWVEQQTNDKIKDLIPQGAIDPRNTVLVLTNAVYFKGDWVQPFDKRNTREEDFAVSAQTKVKAPLMHQRATMGYADEETFQTLELPYAGRELSMVVLLPKKVDGLPELEKAITVDKLASLMAKLDVREVNACLPKFKLETSFKLNRTLQAMGMKRAFGNADFSGISSAAELAISAVLHKAYVDVNEEGTEAAAATAVLLGRAMAVAQPVPTFRADHPFLFLIRDTRSGSILFMGRVNSPTK